MIEVDVTLENSGKNSLSTDEKMGAQRVVTVSILRWLRDLATTNQKTTSLIT